MEQYIKALIAQWIKEAGAVLPYTYEYGVFTFANMTINTDTGCAKVDDEELPLSTAVAGLFAAAYCIEDLDDPALGKDVVLYKGMVEAAKAYRRWEMENVH